VGRSASATALQVKERVMLRYLRENTGNWIIKFFLGIIVIVFVFLGVGSIGSKRNDSVAIVNDESVSIKEYQQAYKMIVDQLRARFGDNLSDDLLRAMNIKQQAVDSLIEEKLVLAEARKLGIVVSEEELQQSLLAMPAFQRDNVFNLDQYKRVLRMNSFTPETFEQNQLRSLKQQKVREVLFSTVNVSDLEARNWILFHNTRTAVNYLRFTPEDYADITPDAEQVKKYYTDNSDGYKSDLKVQSAYLAFSPEDHKSEIKIDHAMIEEYYREQKEAFTTPRMAEARHILIKLEENAEQKEIDSALNEAQKIYEMAVNGDDFQELAKTYSQGPTRESGGYLGTFEKKDMVGPFAEKVFSMKPGSISEPVKTAFGWHIIKLVNMFEASAKPLADVSETIRQELEKNEKQNIAYDKAGEAFDAVIDGDDFEQVALIAGKKIVTSSEFNIDGNGLDLDDKAGFAKTAFALSPGEISDVKQLGDSYYLIKNIKRIEPAVLDFESVKDRVFNDLKAKLQREEAQKQAEKYLAQAVELKDIAQLAEKHSLTYESTDLFTRNGSIEGVENSEKIVKAGFSLSEDNTIFPETVETFQGYYIIGFKERKLPEESEIAEYKQILKSEILRGKQAQFYQTWVAQLRKQSKIKYNTQILQ